MLLLYISVRSFFSVVFIFIKYLWTTFFGILFFRHSIVHCHVCHMFFSRFQTVLCPVLISDSFFFYRSLNNIFSILSFLITRKWIVNTPSAMKSEDTKTMYGRDGIKKAEWIFANTVLWCCWMFHVLCVQYFIYFGSTISFAFFSCYQYRLDHCYFCA